MAYVEVHQELVDHPKVKRMARMLSVHPMQAVGHVLALWCWALDYAFDGDVSRFDAMDIAEAARWDEDPESLVKALVECGPGDDAGLLDPDWRLHDWRMYTAGLAASREAGARGNHVRWHTGRGVHVPECDFCIGGESGANRGANRDPNPTRIPPESGGESTVPNQDEPNPTPPYSPPPPAHTEDDERFEEHFWPAYPARDGKKLGKGRAKLLWRKLSIEQQRRAVLGARHLAASDQLPKDAERFLRPDKAGEFPFDDWQTPAQARASPRDKPATRTADGSELPL